MAKVRKVVGDQHSEEFDALRRAHGSLLAVLENVASEVDAGNITADEAFTVILASLSTGLDSDIAGVDGGANNYAGTVLKVAGVRGTPVHPRRPRTGELFDMDNDRDSDK